MSEFRINTGVIKSELGTLGSAKTELFFVKADLAIQIMKLRAVSSSSAVSAIKGRLGAQSKRISNEIININSLINSGNAICSKVKSAELSARWEMSGIEDIIKNIWPFNGDLYNAKPVGLEDNGALIVSELSIIGFNIGAFKGLINGISKADYSDLSNGNYEIDSVVFDDEGGYGGNQGSAKSKYYWDVFKCWEILDMIHKHYGDMNIFEAFAFTNAVNKSGCGYTAMANSLFVEYEGREDEFEKTFGFPMYKDGDLNYDEMIIALYSTAAKNGIAVQEGKKYPGGTLDGDRQAIMEAYLADKGVKFRCDRDVNVTAENVREIIENGGHIILGYRDTQLNMYNVETGQMEHYGNGVDGCGHAIMVTGVTEDGQLIVSSWGKKYYVNPSDFNQQTVGNNRADTFEVFYYD